jgi:hypothetical protein
MLKTIIDATSLNSTAINASNTIRTTPIITTTTISSNLLPLNNDNDLIHTESSNENIYYNNNNKNNNNHNDKDKNLHLDLNIDENSVSVNSNISSGSCSSNTNSNTGSRSIESNNADKQISNSENNMNNLEATTAADDYPKLSLNKFISANMRPIEDASNQQMLQQASYIMTSRTATTTSTKLTINEKYSSMNNKLDKGEKSDETSVRVSVR